MSEPVIALGARPTEVPAIMTPLRVGLDYAFESRSRSVHKPWFSRGSGDVYTSLSHIIIDTFAMPRTGIAHGTSCGLLDRSSLDVNSALTFRPSSATLLFSSEFAIWYSVADRISPEPRVLSFDSNAPTFVSQEWPETTRFLLAEEETGKRFRKLVSARVVDDSAYRWIVDNGSAQTVIDTAVADYREHGNERRLSLAASLLGDMGLHAAESLRRLFSTGAAESEYFVDVAFCARDILPGELAQIAYTLATNPHADVRRRLLTNLHEHDRIDARLVLRTLCDDEEEDIACLARELFSSIS